MSTLVSPFRWEEAENGNVPENAIEVGETTTGETLYVGRAYIDGDLVPGKIVPSRGVCYVGCNRREDGVANYEVLVSDLDVENLTWVAANGGEVPEGAVVGGKVTATEEDLYVCRAHPPGEPDGWHSGKVHPSHGCAYIPYGGTEHRLLEYEVLVDSRECIDGDCCCDDSEPELETASESESEI